jgi:hypothetical protein
MGTIAWIILGLAAPSRWPRTAPLTRGPATG